MSKTNVSVKLIIACILAVVGACLFAAQTAGMLNIKGSLTQLPVIKTFTKAYAPAETVTPALSAVEVENQKLREDNRLLTERVNQLDSEKNGLLKQLEEVKLDLDTLTEYKNKKESDALQAEQLAVYYKNMKPDAVVRVMNNLDDDTVVLILPLLEVEQVARILALFEPHRAALITQLLLKST